MPFDLAPRRGQAPCPATTVGWRVAQEPGSPGTQSLLVAYKGTSFGSSSPIHVVMTGLQ
jgi:hypothetical protein